MFDEFSRATQRLEQMRERIRVGKISGAVGTHAHLDPRVEKLVCEKLGLKLRRFRPKSSSATGTRSS